MNELNIIHTANKNIWEVDLSETLTYTIIIYNVTDEIIENLDIEIHFDQNTYYVKDSFTLNGINNEYNPNTNIFIPRINPKENLIITLDIKLLDHEYPSEIISFTSINYSKLDYSKSLTYNDGSWDSPKSYVEKTSENTIILTSKSKEISTPIISRNIFIQHDISPKTIKLEETLDYQFIIRNNGSINIDEAVLENISNGEIDFIKDSLYINTVNIKNTNFKNGIYVGCLHPKETVLINFKAKVKKLNALNYLSNKGVLKFFYKNDSILYPFPRQIESNEEVVDITPDISKSINISKIISIPMYNAKVSQVLDIFNYGVEITTKKIVNSIKGYSLEQHHSVGKNVFLIGNIKGRITYNSEQEINCSIETKIYTIEYEIPFKTEILMPDNFNDYIESIVNVEFLDATLLDSERIYVNAVLNIDLINN